MIKIIPVVTKKQKHAFIEFTLNLYKGNPYAVPELTMDTMSAMDKKNNPSYEFSEAQPYLAYKDGKISGRVIALINHRANEIWEKKQVRFGWIDFIEDYEVAKALLDQVASYGREHGMNQMEGPLGFTDFDREGALTRGYDRIATMATIYNYPYYIDFYKQYGLVKAAEWYEFLVHVPTEMPEKYNRMRDIICHRYNLHLEIGKNHHQMVNVHAHKIFDLLNECYAPLHGFSKLSPKQIDKYTSDYITFANLELVPMIYDKNNELVAVGIMIPSIAKAIQKANGKLFPFGWIPILRARYGKNNDTVEFLLIAIKPEYQGKGLNAVLMTYLYPVFQKYGYKYCETNCELEENLKIQNLWNSFERENHKNRVAFTKEI